MEKFSGESIRRALVACGYAYECYVSHENTARLEEMKAKTKRAPV